MSRNRRVIALLVLCSVLLALPLHSALAQGIPPSQPEITSVSCTLTVRFNAPDTETSYRVEIWDDAALVFDVSQMATTAGQLLTYTYTFTEIGDVAPGVAVVVYGNDTQLFFVDPYTEIDETCIPGALPASDCPLGVPSGSVVGLFVASTPTYFSPGNLTSPLVSIDAGKTAWVIGQDASGQYHKIFWACGYLWVPVNTMGPNPDAVWNNTPLPARTVS